MGRKQVSLFFPAAQVQFGKFGGLCTVLLYGSLEVWVQGEECT